MNKGQNDIFDTLSETRRMLGDLEIPDAEEFSLDAILAEFGQGAAEPALTEPEVEQQRQEEQETSVLETSDILDAPLEEEVEDLPPPAVEQEEDWTAPESDVDLPEQEEVEEPIESESPRKAAWSLSRLFEKKKNDSEEEPAEEMPTQPEEVLCEAEEEQPVQEHHISLEDVMAHTVDAVMEEREEQAQPVPLKDRVKAAKVAAAAAAQRWKKRLPLLQRKQPVEDEGPEPDMEQLERELRRKCKRIRRQLFCAAIPVVLLIAIGVLETWEPLLLQPLWENAALLREGSMLGLLVLTALLSGEVWKSMIGEWKARRFTCELAAALLTVAVLADGICLAVSQAPEHLPLAAPAAVLIWVCLAGRYCAETALHSACRLIDLGGQPPYSVTVSPAGACKQQGKLEGFYRTARKNDPARSTQTVLLPLVLSAATVLAGVVCIGEERSNEFFYIWSVLLILSVPLGLPLSGTLPLRNLNHRLCRSASAVAGYAGACAVGAPRRMVVTDGDLFPPGTVSLNGLKLYGEEIGKVVSYAATVTKAARSQLHPIFEQLLSSEGGSYYRAEGLRFYEEGGVSATIAGETVSMGSAYFMKKQKVDLPRELKVKTGVFMAVDGRLVAIFAMKYQASHNVEWALRAMKRSRIEPVLAVRSGNITPGLIRRRFNLDPRAVYPEVSARLALSDMTREQADKANAIIYREGLMPFAEAVIGSRRCCRAVRRATVLCWLGSLVGLWLGYYLSHLAAYGVLNAGYILLFLLLWLLPVLLLADMARQY